MPSATLGARSLFRAFVTAFAFSLALFVALSLLQGEASADDGLPDDESSPNWIDADAEAGDIIEGSYIVVLKDAPGLNYAAGRQSPAVAVRSAAQRQGAKITHTYDNAINGFAAEMSAAQATALQADPSVAYVEPDRIFTTQVEQVDPPWGLDRIDQRGPNLNGSYFHDRDGTGVDVYVVDTGIRSTHDEFGGRVGSGYVAVSLRSDGRGTEDCDGHGTHVAGTAGGATYGVAKNVNLIPVRVLNCEGTGATTEIVAGLDWIAANASGPSVVNVSIGGPFSQSFEDAVARVHDAGVTIVVAAANDNRDACDVSPSGEAKAITVASTNPDDRRSRFSNYGECVDLFAPGYQVRSAWWFGDDELNDISGTSMAAPHVTGVVAQLLSASPDMAPDDVAIAIIGGATPDVVTDPRANTPNLLLYSYITGDPAPPTDPPPNNVIATVDVAERMAEGAGQASALQVEFNHYPLSPVTIDWEVIPGTVDPATDFFEPSGSVTLTAEDLRVDLTDLLVANWVRNDAEVEPVETLQLSYTVSGGAVAAASTVDLEILDNDGFPAGTAEVIDDFETDRGWIIDPVGNNAATGNFEVAAMNASPSIDLQTYQLGAAVSGTNALVTGGLAGSGAGTYDVDAGSTAAERTISIPTAATYLDVFHYFAHYDNSSRKDVLELRIGDDVILRHEGAPQTIRPASWLRVRADVSDYAGQDVVFSASVGDLGDPSLVEAAIDDIVVWTNPFSCAVDAGTLTWTDAAQQKYWVYKSTDGVNFSWIGRTTGATTFVDPSPSVGAVYQVHYAGIARVLCETTAEPSPSQLFNCASDAGTLSWNDAAQSKYWVYKSTDGGATYSWIGRTTGATTFTDPTPTVGALYQVHYAGISRVACAITAEPAESSAFVCAVASDVLTWTDAGQSKYWVYKSADGGLTYQWIGRTTGATTFTDPGSAAGDLYQVHYAGIPRVNCS